MYKLEAARSKAHACDGFVFSGEVRPCPNGHKGLAFSFGVWLHTFPSFLSTFPSVPPSLFYHLDRDGNALIDLRMAL